MLGYAPAGAVLSFPTAMTRTLRSTAFTRSTLGLVCALLLFAQQIGLAHAVWHATQQVPQPQSVAERSDAPKLPHASKLCPLDAALGQVLGIAGPTGFSFDVAEAGEHTHDAAALVPASVPAPRARSRGPPAVL